MRMYLLVVGLLAISLKSYTQPGTLDPNYGDSGIVKHSTTSIFERIVVQADGRIIVFNSVNNHLLRFNIDGTLDNSFGNGSPVFMPDGGDYGPDIALQPNGRILY